MPVLLAQQDLPRTLCYAPDGVRRTLTIEAHAPTIESVRIAHARTGLNSIVYGKCDGCAWCKLSNAKGNLKVKLISVRPEKFQVRYNFIEE